MWYTLFKYGTINTDDLDLANICFDYTETRSPLWNLFFGFKEYKNNKWRFVLPMGVCIEILINQAKKA